MASFVVNVPDAAVNDLVAALALRLGVAEPTTPAGKAALAEAWARGELFRVWVDWRAQRAAEQARAAAGSGW